MASEEDLRVAQQVVAQFIGDGQSVPLGTLPLVLRDAIATAITTARAETWKEAIATINLKFPTAEGSIPRLVRASTVIAALEAAAGSKTKVVDEQKNQRR